MNLNDDFTQRAAVHAAQLPWQASPVAGVDRRMLDRVGDEVARATSLVRYAPNSLFSPHTHGGGEEFLVLDGVFVDERGDYPVGSYVRNPPSSSHTPGSTTGCVIFVKLWQFDPTDRTTVRRDTNQIPFATSSQRPGVDLIDLFSSSSESVRLERWEPNSRIDLVADRGIELLVVEGEYQEGGETFEPMSWLRLPPRTRSNVVAGSSGCKVWIKADHLDPPRGLCAQ